MYQPRPHGTDLQGPPAGERVVELTQKRGEPCMNIPSSSDACVMQTSSQYSWLLRPLSNNSRLREVRRSSRRLSKLFDTARDLIPMPDNIAPPTPDLKTEVLGSIPNVFPFFTPVARKPYIAHYFGSNDPPGLILTSSVIPATLPWCQNRFGTYEPRRMKQWAHHRRVMGRIMKILNITNSCKMQSPDDAHAARTFHPGGKAANHQY
ncbi:hypothetical protein FB45DRAFT_868684 [Roridomyces roridus]|uniref:Uncharacterized protein n=1 Tax=Roridomyces roridus TaxID=1738132 RepID=A0AAD7FJD0_9AGAR|nr:hypothetical protein FB45DRAFT_868684 [Roridomyces roridus]